MKKLGEWIIRQDWNTAFDMFMLSGLWFLMGILLTLTTLRDIRNAQAKEIKEEAEVSLFADFKADAILNEGKVFRVYRDTEGNLTGGIGHLLTDEEMKTWDEGEALTKETVGRWFDNDFSRLMFGIAKHFPEFHKYPHVVKLAMMNWMFQLGNDAPKKFPRATEAIKKRDWSTAALEWEYGDLAARRKSLWFHETPARCLQEVHRLQSAANGWK